jgi:hypothetical protein
VAAKRAARVVAFAEPSRTEAREEQGPAPDGDRDGGGDRAGGGDQVATPQARPAPGPLCRAGEGKAHERRAEGSRGQGQTADGGRTRQLRRGQPADRGDGAHAGAAEDLRDRQHGQRPVLDPAHVRRR